MIALSVYLRMSAPTGADTPIALRQAEWRHDIEVALFAAAILLYLIAIALARLTVRFTPAPASDDTGEVFE